MLLGASREEKVSRPIPCGPELSPKPFIVRLRIFLPKQREENNDKGRIIPILEAALRQADSHIEYISLETKDDWDSIRVYYEDTSTLIIPVPNLSLMAILAKVSDRCAAEKELRLLEKSAPTVWPVPAGGFDEWAITAKAQAEAEKFLEYRYRLSGPQTDYIFGKMALFLLQNSD